MKPASSEEQDYTAQGEGWDTAISAERPADEIGLYLGPIYRAGAALSANTETMSVHLAEIALAVAGWHMTGKLDVPDNISIVALPAKCPELSPVENI